MLGCRGGWYGGGGGSRQNGSRGQGEIHFSGIEMKGVSPGLSLRGEDWGFPPATKNVASGWGRAGGGGLKMSMGGMSL